MTIWLMRYLQSITHISGLPKQLQFHRPQSVLSTHRETIEAHLREHPPQTINEAVAVLETLTGIRRSPTQVRLFLKQLGLKCRKVGWLPAKGDPEEQETYRQEQLEPRLAEAQTGNDGEYLLAGPCAPGSVPN